MPARGDGASPVIVWFRRDLRVEDHPALTAAVETGRPVLALFIFDDLLLAGRHASGPRTQFMLECLADLDAQLRERGSALVWRRGDPTEVLADIARDTGARAIHFTRDLTPYARSRGRRVAAACAAKGVELVAHPGLCAAQDAAALRTGAGTAYKVFSAFHRAWSQAPRRDVLPAPDHIAPCGLDGLRPLPTLAEIGLSQTLTAPARGGSCAAHSSLEAFLAGPIDRYGSAGGHDALASEGTSRLSPYLRFGCVSPRQVEAELSEEEGAQAFRRQLCWRDFYLCLLHHFPRNSRLEFQERYRALAWRDAPADLDRWRAGQTGYPLVDAGMRQLCEQGWMHNRARLVAGSFLTKHLGIDWREGESWFMSLLLDGDPAANNGNWQWIASVGSDPQPVSRRLLSPMRQQARFDPDGSYVRRWVSELRGVPDEHLAQPWEMPTSLQQEVGCIIGRDYPTPIVDHAVAPAEALSRYASA